MNLSTFLRLAASLALSLTLPATWAQGFPSKPVKLVVPYAPGGLPDVVARILAQKLQGPLGQPVVVENRPGASGARAASALAQAPADGHTLMLTNGPDFAIAPLLTKRLSYDPVKDFTPVSLVGTAPLYLAVNASVKANTIDELIALAKSKPGVLTYGSAGTGSIHHLTAEAMKEGLGISITHIPYRGSSASVPALIGGQVDMVFAAPPSLLGFVKTGQAKLLAINSAKRSEMAPSVPTLGEKIPGFDFTFNVVVVARTGTPPEAVHRLSAEIARIIKTPEVVASLRMAGIDPVGGTPEQLAAAMRKEGDRLTKAAKRANLQAE